MSRFLLLRKFVANGHATLHFVGMFETEIEAESHTYPEKGVFGELSALRVGIDDHQLLGTTGLPPKSIRATKVVRGMSYLLAEYTS